MNFTLLEDTGFGFQVEVKEQSKFHINFNVYEITGRDLKGEAVDLELYLTCSIKWDGCCHFWFGEREDDGQQDGYLHMCGVRSFKNHFRLMKELYQRAFELMGREPEDNVQW